MWCWLVPREGLNYSSAGGAEVGSNIICGPRLSKAATQLAGQPMALKIMFSGAVMRRRAAKCSAGLCLVLAGCGAFEESQAPACPSVRTLATADNVTKFRDGPGRDLTDVVMEAEIVGFGGFCETDIDARRVDIELTVTIEALRGPAVREGSTEVAYFVSVLDGDGEILRKPVFRTTLEFEGNIGRVRASEDRIHFRNAITYSERRAKATKVRTGLCTA